MNIMKYKLLVDPYYVYGNGGISCLLLIGLPFAFMQGGGYDVLAIHILMFSSLGIFMFMLMYCVGHNAFNVIKIDDAGIRTKHYFFQWSQMSTLHIATAYSGIGRECRVYIYFSSEKIPESDYEQLVKRYNKKQCILFRITGKSKKLLYHYCPELDFVLMKL